MATKQEVLRDIEQTLGFAPGWLAQVPENTIEAEWSLLKNWEMAETATQQVQRAHRSWRSGADAMSLLCLFSHRSGKTIWRHRCEDRGRMPYG